MATTRRPWTRTELLVALGLYLQLPFGQLHRRNPKIIKHAILLERSPSALAMKLTNLASLDESLKRSGLRNASKADREVWAEMQSDWSATAEAIAEANQAVGAEALDNDDSQPFALGKDVIAETTARRGQALFRATVLSAYQNRCCITGLDDARLLNASHIVPWRDDPGNRLNPRNGLCLSTLHDRAFDRGLITFDADLRLLLSPELDRSPSPFISQAFATYAGQRIELPEKFAPDITLLRYHRERVFIEA